MFARRMLFSFKVECVDDAVALFRTSVIPGARKQRGFRGGGFLTDRKTGKAIAVTFWRNEKDALANEDNRFFQNQLEAFIPYFAGPPIREGYEVSLHRFERRSTKRKSAFARLTIMQLQPERIPEAIRLYRMSVVPDAKKQKGFRGLCLLADVKGGKGISATFWRNEKDALANEENLYYQQQLVKFLGMLSGPMIREGYEVRVDCLETIAASKTETKRAPVRKRTKKT